MNSIHLGAETFQKIYIPPVRNKRDIEAYHRNVLEPRITFQFTGHACLGLFFNWPHLFVDQYFPEDFQGRVNSRNTIIGKGLKDNFKYLGGGTAYV